MGQQKYPKVTSITGYPARPLFFLDSHIQRGSLDDRYATIFRLNLVSVSPPKSGGSHHGLGILFTYILVLNK